MAGDMDAVELLTHDHRTVEGLFERYESTTDPDERTSIIHEVVHELAVHGEVEELLFYPRLREALDDGDALADEAVEEHLEIKETLNELDKMTAADDGVDERVHELMREVRHHVEEEEADLFPRAREALSGQQLLDLGTSMQGAKSMVPTRPHPHAPTSPAGKVVATPPAALVDRVRDALRSVRS